MDRQDTILMLTMYKSRNLMKAQELDGVDPASAKRYRAMADWFAEAIKREEELIKKEESDDGTVC